MMEEKDWMFAPGAEIEVSYFVGSYYKKTPEDHTPAGEGEAVQAMREAKVEVVKGTFKGMVSIGTQLGGGIALELEGGRTRLIPATSLVHIDILEGGEFNPDEDVCPVCGSAPEEAGPVNTAPYG